MSDIEEIVSALLHVRRAFLKAGMSTPETIELDSFRDGQALMSLANRCYLNEMQFRAEEVQIGPDSFRHQCHLAGFKVRWPIQ